MAILAFALFEFLSQTIVTFTERIFGHTAILEFAVPKSRREIPFFIVEMLVIGFSEELVWRSYIQSRLREMVHSSWQAVFVTSLLFGILHLYQGFSGVVSAFLFGVVIGSFFEWKRAFLPIALGHATIDLVYTLMTT